MACCPAAANGLRRETIAFMTGPASESLGLYISIPFCRSKCTYCNFASGVYPASDHSRYVDLLVEEMRQAGGWASGLGLELPRRVDTIYLGGGTPSLLEPELIGRLFAAIHAEFAVEAKAEITAECAPGQLSDETLHALVDAGANRMSLGVQSFVDREAKTSGRLHSRAKVLDDLRRLRAAGVESVNLDLIAGLAGQTIASWEESLSVLVDCDVSHASIYMLEVDEDSRLGREMLAGGARYFAELVPADDTIAQMYEIAIERLEGAGLKQYEISNFAKSGFESRHNLRYWQRRPYLGLGLDASSMLRADAQDGDGREPRYVLRSTNTDNLNEYLGGASARETAWLSPERQHEEAWFLGLRMNAGVRPRELRREFGAAVVERSLESAARLADSGLLVWEGETIRLTPQGRLISNDVFVEFVESSMQDHVGSE
jgi:oxygen-independent coproporphyrinogen III oxidase